MSDVTTIDGFGLEFLARIEKWQKLKKTLGETKDAEADLRREICEEMFDGKTGKFEVAVSDGDTVVTAKSKINVSLSYKDLLALIKEASLTEDELKCYNLKVSLLTGVSKLPKESRLRKAITSKPAMPELIVE